MKIKRKKTLVNSFDKMLKKYLPEFSSVFANKKEVVIEDVMEATGFSKRYSYNLLTILCEFGWIESSEKDKYNRKKWNINSFGLKMLEK